MIAPVGRASPVIHSRDGRRVPAPAFVMIPVRHVASSVLGAILSRQPLSPAKVNFAWQTSTGAALARATDVTLQPGGTLDVHAASAHWAREVKRSRHVLLERMQALLGPDAVTRISVTA